jgi:hypothetical protein
MVLNINKLSLLIMNKFIFNNVNYNYDYSAKINSKG